MSTDALVDEFRAKIASLAPVSPEMLEWFKGMLQRHACDLMEEEARLGDQDREEEAAAWREVEVKYEFRVIIYREGSKWTARCLELDITESGYTSEEALYHVQNAIATTAFYDAGERDEQGEGALNIYKPSHPVFFKLYAEADEYAVQGTRPGSLDGLHVPDNIHSLKARRTDRLVSVRDSGEWRDQTGYEVD
jgi:hypothetical protein